MKVEEFNSTPKNNAEAESDDATKFDNSLQELKDLCSQLHHAADYCEKAVVKAEEKRDVVENTKEYLCRAVVTVVDHLGCVSAKLECRISIVDTSSETELRIDGLTHRLATCQQYSNKLALTRHSIEVLKRMKQMPRGRCATILYTYNFKPSLIEDSKQKSSFSPPVLPVRDGLSVVPKSQNSKSFKCPYISEARKQKRNILNWKPMQGYQVTNSTW
ncbi:unnamed protein product [Withania somnifera]